MKKRECCSGWIVSDNIFAKQADRGGHVRSQRGSEDDLSNASLGKVFTFLFYRVRGPGNGKCINGLVINILTSGLEIELGEGAFDCCHFGRIKAVACDEVRRGSSGDECGNDLGGIPGLLLVHVNRHGGVGTDVKSFLSYLVTGSLYDRDGNCEVFGIGRIDQRPVTDSSGEVKNLGSLCTDVNRNSLLAGKIDAGKLSTIIVKELHSRLLHFLTCAEPADLCDRLFETRYWFFSGDCQFWQR